MSKETIYPIFKKDYAYFYKAISDSLIVQIFESSFSEACQINYLDNELIVADVIKKDNISEAEFLEAFYSVRKKLDDLCLIKINK